MVGDYIRISKYTNVFPKVSAPNWTKQMLEIKNLKDASSWTDVIEDLNGE